MSDITLNLCHHDFNQTICNDCLPYYPRKCSCGGLIHATISDNHFHGMTIVYKCDQCDFILDAIEEEF